MTNDKIEDSELESIEEEIQINEGGGVQMFQMDYQESKFVSMLNDLSPEYSSNKKKDNQDNKISSNSDPNGKMNIDDVLKLSDEKLYDYLDFETNVHNWNDYLQPKFPNRTLNEIKTIDVDIHQRSSYFKGREFFTFANFNSTYRDNFEDNFRHLLENCDNLEILNFNVDHNTFWGGISLTFLEQMHEMIPKVMKVVNASDFNSSFFNEENDFNIEKYLNYVFYLSDLFDLEETKVLVNPIFTKQSTSFVNDVFGYQINTKDENDPVYNYYFSALNALQLQSLYMPLRTKYYGKSTYLRNHIINESHLNFIESDLIFKLDVIGNKLPKDEQSNGNIMNFSRNFRNKGFSWKKLFQSSFPLSKYNSSIIYGYSSSYLLMNEKYDRFLDKMSKVIFSSEDQFDLPICFPRKYFDTNNKPYYTKNMSVLENNRPFVDYCLVYLKNFKKLYKDYDLSVNKFLSHIDQEKYFEYKDKAESIFNMIYTYKDFAENMLNKFDDSEDEDDDID